MKFFPIGAALATVLSAQIAETQPLIINAQHPYRANSSTLVVSADSVPVNIASQITVASRATQRGYDSPQDSNQVGTLVVLGAIAATAAVAIASSVKANKPVIVGHTTRDTNRFDKASPKLQKRLMTLLHNDRAAANRLIANIQLNHPHQSINWAIEKAIYDLERDRGGR